MADETIPEPCPYPSRGELESALLAAELEALAVLQEVPS
jgi:hypothetical protein